MPIRQSISWWCFANRGVADDVLLQKAAAIGFQAVELIDEKMFARVRDLGLVIAAHGGHQSIAQGLNDPAQHDRIEAEIGRSLALAQQYEIPNLIVFSGNRRPGLSDEEGLENTVLGLSRVTQAAEEAGVTLILELLNSKVDHPGLPVRPYRLGRGSLPPRRLAPCATALRHLSHAGYGRQCHFLHPQNRAYFAHYHTAGVPGRHDLDDTQELNYPPILRALAATGYNGFVAHEFIPKGDPVAALEAAYRLCDV